MSGRGDVLNTLLGALTLAIIGTIMNLSNLPGYPATGHCRRLDRHRRRPATNPGWREI
jgi:hypothetical protein